VAGPRKQRANKGPTPGAREAQLIFNPSAGGDNQNNAVRLAEIVSGLRAHGIEPRIGVKTSGKVTRELVRDARRSRLPLVIVAAGDGTVEEVASQLVGTDTTLAIVPIGTMNNLARCLGVPLGIEEACALIGMSTTRHIDVGHVTSNDRETSYFLECAGAGLTAIGALAGQKLEKHEWRFVPRILRGFFEAKLGVMRVTMDDTTMEASTKMVTVSNAPMMGSNLWVAPEAKMDDGMLDVVLYDGMGDAALLKHFMAANTGNPEKLPIHRARHVRITADESLAANSDKDVTPRTRIIDIEVLPRSLTVIAGNGIALTVPVEAAPSVAASPDGEPAANGSGGDHKSALERAKPVPERFEV